MKHLMTLGMVLMLAGCGGGMQMFDRPGGGLFGPRPAEPAQPVPRPEAADETATAEDSDPDAAADGAVFGITVASLGDATIPGLWIETPYVTRERPGQVIAANGQRIDLILRPSGGELTSGSRMSLAAFQALGIPLTDLPTVTVVADG